MSTNAFILLDEQKFVSEGRVVGWLGVNSDEDFYANEIRVKVRVTEIIWPILADVEPPKNVLYSKEVVLHGKSHITKGSKSEFPFDIVTSVKPTAHLSVVVVEIKGIVAIGLRRDIVCEKSESIMSEGVWNLLASARIQLAHSLPQHSTVMVIVKETIKIPCKYCGFLMPAEASKCTNCGAKFTR